MPALSRRRGTPLVGGVFPCQSSCWPVAAAHAYIPRTFCGGSFSRPVLCKQVILRTDIHKQERSPLYTGEVSRGGLKSIAASRQKRRNTVPPQRQVVPAATAAVEEDEERIITGTRTRESIMLGGRQERAAAKEEARAAAKPLPLADLTGSVSQSGRVRVGSVW